jgi:hypothetical protein
MPTLHIPKHLLEAELARRKGLVVPLGQFRLEDYLFDKQLAFVRDLSPFKAAVTTRRAGKSVSCVADLLHTATTNAAVVCLYITLSRKNAKRLVWPEFKRLNSKFSLAGNPNESDLSMSFPNRSVIYLLGANDKDSIADFRGLAIKKVYIDEAQSFPSYIEPLIDDVIGPALMDHDGQLILIGTPGPIPNGYFFELTKNANWSHHHWSFFDNPKLPALSQGKTHQDMLNRELIRRGVTTAHPSIQREWFGRWILDENSLVYHYDANKNDYGRLPEGQWTYLLGIDLGFEDADALAVLAYREGHRETYLLEESITRHQDLTALCQQIDKLKLKYDFDKIVVDTGGLGKKITEEISKRYSIPMVAAEKTRKVEYIELMNDDLRTGRLKIRSTSQFAEDAAKVEWDHDKSTPDKKIISKRFHSDICEAVLYAWRESYSYTNVPEAEKPIYQTEAWGTHQEAAMLQNEIDRLEELRELNGPMEERSVEFNPEDHQELDRPRLRYQGKFDNRIKT